MEFKAVVFKPRLHEIIRGEIIGMHAVPLRVGSIVLARVSSVSVGKDSSVKVGLTRSEPSLGPEEWTED